LYIIFSVQSILSSLLALPSLTFLRSCQNHELKFHSYGLNLHSISFKWLLTNILNEKLKWYRSRFLTLFMIKKILEFYDQILIKLVSLLKILDDSFRCCIIKQSCSELVKPGATPGVNSRAYPELHPRPYQRGYPKL